MRFTATPGWGPADVAVAISGALGGGFPFCVCSWRGACAWCLYRCVCCVFVVSVLVVVRVWVCLVCVVVGPSPLVAEDPECDSPPLLAGFRCLWWCVLGFCV